MSVAERYDRASEDYGRYWAPVLDVAARGTVDAAADAVEAALARSAAAPDAPRATLVDVGTGAGVLVIDAWRRWGARGLRVVGTDASRGMLDAARHQAAAAGIPDAALEWLHGDAAHLPLPDAAADVIVSSFVYQLVPDRHAAFREARRVLRPRGVLALTTWLDVETPFAPADEFDEAVLDLDIEEDDDPRDDEVVAGDFESVKAAAAQLRRAGFHAVDAREVTLEYRWDLDRYLEYKRSYGEQALFGELDVAVAEALMRRARERLEQLTPDAFVWRTPVVLAVATRP